MPKMTVELSWDEVEGPTWMNPDNLAALLYGETATRQDLLRFRVLPNSSLPAALEQLGSLSDHWNKADGVINQMEEVLDALDDWLTEHYNEDGDLSVEFRKEYTKRVAAAHGTCGWCQGLTYRQQKYVMGKPGLPEYDVEHNPMCPLKP